jgi:hypothetical protein
MDRMQENLLRMRPAAEFFDADLPRNQFLTEVVLHRALLASPWRVDDPEDADLLYVPFYARLAYPGDRTGSAAQRSMHKKLTSGLTKCLRRSRAWQRSKGADHVVALSSTRDPRRLFGPAWPLLRSAYVLRVEGADKRFKDRGVLRPSSQVGTTRFSDVVVCERPTTVRAGSIA